MPNTEDKWEKVAEDFQLTWNFPNCRGALDGKHIRIKPPAKSGSVFYNYKGTFSVVLMALVDAKYRFLYCDVGFNGRVSDGGVFAQCSLNEGLLKNVVNVPKPKPLSNNTTSRPMSYHVVADEAFPLRDDIMKPYAQRNLTVEKRIFNYRLSRARRVVENAFGILSNRSRVFLTTIAVAPEMVEVIVLAACVLHNYLILRRDAQYVQSSSLQTEKRLRNDLQEGLRGQQDHLQSIVVAKNKNPLLSAKFKRENLTSYFVSSEGAVDRQCEMV